MATAPHRHFFHSSTPTPQKTRRGRLQPRQTSPSCKLTTGELAPPAHRLSDPGAHAWRGNVDQGEQVKCPHLPQPQLHCQASPFSMWVRYREPRLSLSWAATAASRRPLLDNGVKHIPRNLHCQRMWAHLAQSRQTRGSCIRWQRYSQL